MMTRIDFYFDFMSPFAYLARHRLVHLAGQYRADIGYKPIDLPRIKRAIGNNGPSNSQLPVKLNYLVKDLKRWAAMYGIPLGFPVDLNTERINKGVFYALRQNGDATAYVKEAYQMTWVEGGAPDDEALLKTLALRLGWDPDKFLEFLGSGEARDAYEASNQEAISRGVFGVPTIIIGDEMWWGNDRLFMVEDYLAKSNKKIIRESPSSKRTLGQIDVITVSESHTVLKE